MTSLPRQIYVIAENDAARAELAALVRISDAGVIAFASAKAFLETYDGHRPACIVADMRILSAGDNGAGDNNLLLELRRCGLSVPVIFLTDQADTSATVQAMKQGAYTALDKASQDSNLKGLVKQALQEDIQRSQDDRFRDGVRQRLSRLNEEQRAVLRGILAGEPNKKIAHHLRIGVRTVETRRRALYRKMEIESVIDLVRMVLLAEPGLLPPHAPK